MKSTVGLENSVKNVVTKVPFVVKGLEAREVSVTGDFTRWSVEGIPLAKRRDGAWETTLALEPGEYQYRLRVNGEWRSDQNAQKRVANPYGSENCVLEVRRGI